MEMVVLMTRPTQIAWDQRFCLQTLKEEKDIVYRVHVDTLLTKKQGKQKEREGGIKRRRWIQRQVDKSINNSVNRYNFYICIRYFLCSFIQISCFLNFSVFWINLFGRARPFLGLAHSRSIRTVFAPPRVRITPQPQSQSHSTYELFTKIKIKEIKT